MPAFFDWPDGILLTMSSVAFDTLKYARRLKQAGVPEKQAEAEALAEVFETNLGELGTKSDLRELEVRLVGQLTLVKWMLALVIIVNAIPALKVVFG